MSGCISNYLAAKFLNQALGGVAPSLASSLYLHLVTVVPNQAFAGGTVVTGSGYAPLSITCNQTNWPAAAGGAPTTISNALITFAAATGDWSSQTAVAGWALSDNATYGSGNLYFVGTLTEAKPVLSGDTFSFPATNLEIELN